MRLSGGGNYSASNVDFDNTSTSLSSTNVQDAIEELDDKFGKVGDTITITNGSQYAGSTFNIVSNIKITFITEKYVHIAFNAIASSSAGTGEPLLKDLPFTFYDLVVTNLFVDRIYSNIKTACVYTSGNKVFCHHDIMNDNYYGHLVARIQ